MPELRQSPRKVLRTKVLLALEGREPVIGKTTDVGANGCSVNVVDPVPVGDLGRLAFDLLVDGRFVRVDTRVKAMYCIFSGGDFKIGFQFLNLDLSTVTALARYLK